MPGQQRPLKVFLCHASADKPKVRDLYDYLKRRRIRPWFDEVDLEGGQDWQLEIPKAISTSDAIIICLSNSSVDKEGYVQREIKYALDKALEMPEGRIYIVPVRFEECEVPISLRRYQWVDLYKTEGLSKLMKSLKTRALQLQRVPTAQVPTSAEEDLRLSATSTNPGSLAHESDLEQETSKSLESPSASKRDRRLNTQIIVAIIGAVATILAAFIASPSLGNLFVPSPEPTAVSSSVPTSTQPVATKTPTPSVTPTRTRPPTLTFTPEPGYFIVDPEEALNIGYTLRSLGQLAIEKYPPDDLKKMDNTLTFTVNSTADVPILWRWFWCAATTKILEKNMTRISILFDADGYLIPEDRLAKIIFTNPDPTFEGWQCLTYQTVLRDWKPGSYKFTQTMTISAPLNDGRDNFEAGYKTYEYIVNITP